MTLTLITIATVASTLLGGLFALKFRDKLHLILGFSAGAVIGVAFFDLMPEALELVEGAHDAHFVTMIVAFGFLFYMILDRVVALHAHDHDEDGLASAETGHSHSGTLGAGSFAVHSFLDGVAIGLAFQVSAAVGIVVAIAVLVHDFSDGINTVSAILKSGGTKRRAFLWLIAGALAPVLGVIATQFFTLSSATLGLVLASFCGFFLYIGASDLLPESHHRHPTWLTSGMTVLGMAVLYVAIQFAH